MGRRVYCNQGSNSLRNLKHASWEWKSWNCIEFVARCDHHYSLPSATWLCCFCCSCCCCCCCCCCCYFCCCCFCRHLQGSFPQPHRCQYNYNRNHYYKHHHLHYHTITNTMNTTSTMKFTKTTGVDKGPQILRRTVRPNFLIIKKFCGFFRAGFRLSDRRRCTERYGSKFADNYEGATSYRVAGSPTNYLSHWRAQKSYHQRHHNSCHRYQHHQT